MGRKNKFILDEFIVVQELNMDELSLGVLKIFGDKIFFGVEYKSVFVFKRFIVSEFVKQVLECYGLFFFKYIQFVFCDVVGMCFFSEFFLEGIEIIKRNISFLKWWRVCFCVIFEYDCLFFFQNYWKLGDGYSRRYEFCMKFEFFMILFEDDIFGLNENV